MSKKGMMNAITQHRFTKGFSAHAAEVLSEDGGHVDVPDKPECGIYVYISMDDVDVTSS